MEGGRSFGEAGEEDGGEGGGGEDHGEGDPGGAVGVLEFAFRGKNVADGHAQTPKPGNVEPFAEVRQAFGGADVFKGGPNERNKQKRQGVGPAEGLGRVDFADFPDDDARQAQEEENWQGEKQK